MVKLECEEEVVIQESEDFIWTIRVVVYVPLRCLQKSVSDVVELSATPKLEKRQARRTRLMDFSSSSTSRNGHGPLHVRWKTLHKITDYLRQLA
jgi:hypothetical protein